MVKTTTAPRERYAKTPTPFPCLLLTPEPGFLSRLAVSDECWGGVLIPFLGVPSLGGEGCEWSFLVP